MDQRWKGEDVDDECESYEISVVKFGIGPPEDRMAILVLIE